MATTQRGIVTPEAVVLEFDTAGIASRALARAIDGAIQGALLFALILLTLGALGGEGWIALLFVIVGVAFVVFGYPIVCEVAMQGRSPGKAALGLRVVTIEGAPIAPRHAFIRSTIGLVDFLLVPGGFIAVLVALFSTRSQRLGDVFAGTIVLRERTASAPAAAVWFNPPRRARGVRPHARRQRRHRRPVRHRAVVPAPPRRPLAGSPRRACPCAWPRRSRSPWATRRRPGSTPISSSSASPRRTSAATPTRDPSLLLGRCPAAATPARRLRRRQPTPAEDTAGRGR